MKIILKTGFKDTEGNILPSRFSLEGVTDITTAVDTENPLTKEKEYAIVVEGVVDTQPYKKVVYTTSDIKQLNKVFEYFMKNLEVVDQRINGEDIYNVDITEETVNGYYTRIEELKKEQEEILAKRKAAQEAREKAIEEHKKAQELSKECDELSEELDKRSGTENVPNMPWEDFFRIGLRMLNQPNDPFVGFSKFWGRP